ncbi:TonB-dependent receptor [Marinirhabdus gelatinilytica]|uniref:Fe(3+) dicitrate transport protein n=1 Tax=Marinirhabdus gelatinilytica TaxID=1703343 RepID=A0A370QFX2_9FLAO|nr:TonB-dependent receptor [Marinirhabdus gelatinilytica]RDK86940.1 Fe(3+) dicitrate transport protein [Marinirhabdus gelatinilytica]
MKLKLSILLILIAATVSAQITLRGTINAEATGAPIANAEVYITNLSRSTTTDAEGNYVFEDLPQGSHTIVVFSFEYEIGEKTVQLSGTTQLNFRLPLLGETLTEVLITKRKERIFALKQLRDVEGTAIYAGKKNEVVVMDNLTANIATGNARQIYAQVVGLNIYENNDAGLQLNIGGRGLNPNRTSNFNTRQNGYDISADVLGYPESYYTPPAEAIDQIEVVRGAASLQYGTQFGGLINFKLKKPNPNKEIEWISRQFLGSYNLFTSFNSLSGTVGKVGYYTYFNYKTGNDFRPNSQFDSYNAFAKVAYEISEKTKLTGEFSFLDYLAQQPGGLTDSQFEEDPTFSNRTRNWFKVNWKLYSLLLEHQFSKKTEMSLNLFALDASRKTVGFRENRVSQVDNLDAPRELIVGQFRNWGAEGRIITRYNLLENENTILLGAKYYQSNNQERQGPGTNGSDANFSFADAEFPNYARQSDFTFPNVNVALFAENIFQFSEKFSVTPGLRFEYIKTESEGTYKQINFDNAGNPILNETIPDNRTFDRSFVLVGVGLSYKVSKNLEAYGNFSQNYRSVTFNDIRITNPSLTVDPNITDEKGFTADLGVRGTFKNVVRYDVGTFFLSYEDRLGVILRAVSDIQQERFRGNIGDAVTYGVESFIDWNIWKTFSANENFRLNVFSNVALTDSEYTSSQENNVVGNKVEFIPNVNLKTGIGFGYKNFLGSLQYTYLSKQFTDATNSERDFTSQSGIVGEIPAYDILDLSIRYTYKMFRLETGINNLLDNRYFVRRATGYPGPGIIPSQPRTWYAGLQFKI